MLRLNGGCAQSSANSSPVGFPAKGVFSGNILGMQRKSPIQKIEGERCHRSRQGILYILRECAHQFVCASCNRRRKAAAQSCRDRLSVPKIRHLTASMKIRKDRSTATSPRLTPMRNRMRHGLGKLTLCLSMASWISVPQLTASTGLANSATILSPALPKMRLSWCAIGPSMILRHWNQTTAA